MSPSSAPEETVPTDKTSSGEDSESREPVAESLEKKVAAEPESEENLEEETQEKQEEEADEPSEFLQKWQERHEAYLASQKRRQIPSKGGFVSVPAVIAAKLLGIPVFIHESDLSMGLANKIAYKFANLMYTTFEQDPGLTKVKHVGAVTKVDTKTNVIPIQLPDIMSHFDDKLKTLLFVGGSGGAKVFNDFISQHEEALTKRFNIINLTGDSNLNKLSKNIYRVDYVTNLYQPLLEASDLVVTRGGSILSLNC